MDEPKPELMDTPKAAVAHGEPMPEQRKYEDEGAAEGNHCVWTNSPFPIPLHCLRQQRTLE